MEHTVFLTQIIGCITAALVVLLVWEHSRLRILERRVDDLEEASEHHSDCLIQILRRRDE